MACTLPGLSQPQHCQQTAVIRSLLPSYTSHTRRAARDQRAHPVAKNAGRRPHWTPSFLDLGILVVHALHRRTAQRRGPLQQKRNAQLLAHVAVVAQCERHLRQDPNGHLAESWQ
eukprot:3978468-Prymnesium_polylepis.1